jgi:signal transduction histidine kinase
VDSLLEAVSALASARTLDDVMAVVPRAARALTDADGVSFVLREDGMCHYAAEDGVGPLWKGQRFPLEACIPGWTMLHRQITVLPDVYADARITPNVYRPTFVKSLVMVPVGLEDPIATIGVYWAKTHAATKAEQQVLQGLANAAALAMHNVQLIGELQGSLQLERGARQRAEDASQLKDDFLATLSHELRTPLHIIQSWIWQLKRSNKPNELGRALEIIERNAALQSRLIEDLLDMSRASAGKLKIQIQLVNLAALCVAVVDVVQLSARANNVRLELRLESTPHIWGDPDRLQQILWNLLSNAIKFTPPEGRVVLRITRSTRRVCVAVEDTGIGIAPEFLPVMFDRFRQADAGSTCRYGGLGLGLTVVKELVQLHGASVRAESNGVNQGTTVTIEFPVPVVLEQPAALTRRRSVAAPPEVRLDGMSILVVDDEPEGLSTIESILKHHGAEVLKAVSVEEALEILTRHKPALLLADLAMPGRDGFDLVRAVRALPPPLREIPAAVLSAYLASEYGSTAEEAGFQLFIEKPVQPHDLIGQIAQLAGRSVH